MTQQAPETVDQFVVRLRNKADKCSFHPDQKDDRISEQLIKGILWNEEKKKLISKGDELTLTMAIEMSKSFEVSNKNLNEYYSSINNDIRSVEAIGMKPKPKPTAHSNQNNCSRCGTVHQPRSCPAFESQCSKCKKKGHCANQAEAAIQEPTDWVNSLTFSRKQNGKLRVSLDPKDLNKATKRTYHKTPTLEEISHKFSGAKFFSKMDAQHGYWAIHLDDESSLLTTFNSPFGRYRFFPTPIWTQSLPRYLPTENRPNIRRMSRNSWNIR
ncbi:enzymatic polyprotein [Plakobranchus ocellatus]|uniref:Enzymatic polyprotein n=1 Tax=Plakobranchus ocellatus TaxID=259542 RepID=A0AAV4C047_9GAST|nr:enzymatic polyprotein [Plakobranchus ocellatus]